MNNHKEIRLSPDQRWRIEVDVNFIEQLRLIRNLTKLKLGQESGVDAQRLAKSYKSGDMALVDIARLATFFQVQPGELIIWFPEDKSIPERPYYGRGRKNRQVKLRKRTFKQWTAKEDSLLLRLHEAGAGHRALAVQFGRSANACKERVYLLKKRTRDAAQENTSRGS